MFPKSNRYSAFSGDIYPGGPSTWHITDWDQRRVVSVTMDEEQEDESIAVVLEKEWKEVQRTHFMDTGIVYTFYGIKG